MKNHKTCSDLSAISNFTRESVIKSINNRT